MLRMLNPYSQARARALALTIILLSLVPSALAQLSTASVTGVVRDQTGSIVPNAKLTLSNLDTAVKHQSESNSSGNYLFLNIPPGNYSLEVTSPSFTTARVPRVTLAVAQTATIDVALQLGSLTQTVNVEATGELLQSSTAEVGAVIAAKQVVWRSWHCNSGNRKERILAEMLTRSGELYRMTVIAWVLPRTMEKI